MKRSATTRFRREVNIAREALAALNGLLKASLESCAAAGWRLPSEAESKRLVDAMAYARAVLDRAAP